MSKQKECVLCKKVFYKTYESNKKWENRLYCSRECVHKSLEKPPKKHNCDWCGKEMLLTWRQQRRNKNKFCSRECAGSHTGKVRFEDRKERGSHWINGKTKDKRGYILLWMPNHPNAHKKGYILEHKVIMEKHLGRYLKKDEPIFHKNRIPGDNRLSNLTLDIKEVDSVIANSKYQICRCGARLKPSHYIELNCDYCGKKYTITKCKVSNKYINNVCSLGCRGKIVAIQKVKDGTTPKGKTHSNWKGGKVRSGEYIAIHMPDHPHARKSGYVLEHRVIMEKHIDRYITKDEVIHHINGDKTDNRIENLFLFQNRQYHNKIGHSDHNTNTEKLIKITKNLIINNN